jgi:DNA mismatch repair protein MutS
MNQETTPLMAQYREIKNQHKDCILFFRVGDFYETFYEDAVEVSRLLNIALTTRDKNKPNPVPLAGVPFHAAENYVTRLLASGRKVAICEQVEDPSRAKGLVKREVVEILTPGTAVNSQLLDERENNYCLALRFEGNRAGMALIDVSTGEFQCAEGDSDSIHHFLQGKNVKEVVSNTNSLDDLPEDLRSAMGDPGLVQNDADCFSDDRTAEALSRQFGDTAGEITRGLGPLEKSAAGALLHHCLRMRREILPQVCRLSRIESGIHLEMDDETIANLELLEPLRGNDPKFTLIKIIDETLTPMGARKLREWLQKPLARADLIEERLEAVDELYRKGEAHEDLAGVLDRLGDMERVGARIAMKKAIPREFHAFRDSLEGIPGVKEILERLEKPLFSRIAARLHDLTDIAETIARAIVPDPPGHLREGGVIKFGFSKELDELISGSEEAKLWIAGLEKKERERTGIGSLKVGYNKVFGYYIEVSKAHEQSVPADYVAKQTLVNSQRYFTAELKEREQLILETEEKRVALEQRIFEELCDLVASRMVQIREAAGAIAEVDALQSLATAARKLGYRKPMVDRSMVLEIKNGRHPVLEHLSSEPFVPNDVLLDPDRRQFALITGPNMSGKSTFLRQVALITILAQMGSFVPADKARIGVVDKIFTRVGASDRLSRGQSTFLVEMDETARILSAMTDRSLLLLDEIGRGTSTFDGLSIAWAVTEYILQGIKARPRTLFATHFHELTQLKSSYPRLINLKITIKEWEGGIIFLRKVVSGISDRSYGIHAAKIAGLPEMILKRAEEILRSLELRRDLLSRGVSLEEESRSQYSLFMHHAGKQEDTEHSSLSKLNKLRNILQQIEIDNTTPLEALRLLGRLKDEISD